jgi:chromosome segregation ATPase
LSSDREVAKQMGYGHQAISKNLSCRDNRGPFLPDLRFIEAFFKAMEAVRGESLPEGTFDEARQLHDAASRSGTMRVSGRGEIALLELRQAELIDQLSEKAKQEDDLRRQLAEQTDKVERLEWELQRIRQEAETAVAALDDQISLRESERAAAKARIKELYDQVSLRESERAAAQARIKELFDQLDDLMSRRQFVQAEQAGLAEDRLALEFQRAQEEQLRAERAESQTAQAEDRLALEFQRAQEEQLRAERAESQAAQVRDQLRGSTELAENERQRRERAEEGLTAALAKIRRFRSWLTLTLIIAAGGLSAAIVLAIYR